MRAGVSVKKSINILLLATGVAVSETHAENFHYSGFLNQALIHTSDNNFFGQSDDDVSADYREAGLLL
ncbi:MAG TPA: hypothetical protein VFM46_10245, partial [Pseudomonadales bacterium]|nr:hypothetical protein [Pseudomonadales bacterium]